MSISNTESVYGSVTRAFHWVTALLVITLIIVAMIAEDLPYDTSEQLARKAWMFSLHKTLGVSVFFIALLRILWAFTQPKPDPLHPERRLETFAAETAHWLLYGSLVLAPLTGWIHHAASQGFAPIWWPFGQGLPLVPKSEGVSAFFAGLHWVFTKVMVVTILLHIAGALKHHFIDKDITLRRMIGRAEGSVAPASKHSLKPLGAAIGVWAAILVLGAGLGVYSPHGGERAEAASLEEVASDWTVTDGTIEITITQFNADVTGSFADWTSSISFDPSVPQGKAGEVETVVSIGSLTLGSVTDQAMGPDFFNVENFPTATFTADLITQVDGYLAEGTLTLKDQTAPVSMPFSLVIRDDVAEAEGRVTLDRLTFGVGENMPDETSLKFPVEVHIKLTATRASE